MTCIYTYPCSWPLEQGMNMLISCGLLVYVTSCFLNEKESSCCLCPLPIASCWPVPVGALCRRVLSLPPCFFSCLFRVADCCAVFFSAEPAVTSYIFGGEEKERAWLDRYTFLVVCLSEPWPPLIGAVIRPKQMVFPRQFTERKAWCLGREMHVHANLRCDSTEWRGYLLLISRSLACLEGTGVHFQSPSAPHFLSRRTAACSSASLLIAYADSLRYDRYAWTVGFWNSFTRQILEYTDRPTHESLRKTVRF